MGGDNLPKTRESASTSEQPTASSSQNNQDLSGTSNTPRTTRTKTEQKEHVESISNLVWSDVEKINLLDFLHKYGTDSKLVYKCLKNKSEDQVKSFIRTRQRIARAKKQVRINEAAKKKVSISGVDAKVITPLEEWIQYFFQKCMDDKSELSVTPQLMMHLLPVTFLILSLFEAHPDPKDCGGINYKDVYEFLYTVSRGNPIKMLSKPTANFLFTAFYDASKFYRMTALGNGKESYYLNAVSNSASDLADEFVDDNEKKPVKLRTYPGKRKHRETLEKEEKLKKMPECITKLVKTAAVNPFKIPLDYLEFPFGNSEMERTRTKQRLQARHRIHSAKPKSTEPF